MSTSPDTIETQPASIEALLLPVLGPAYRTAYHLTRDASDAEDAVQQAAVLACRGFDGFEQGSNFRAWFLRIVTNVCLSDYRRRRRSPVARSLDEPTGESELTPAEMLAGPSADRPDIGLVQRLDAAQISAALGALPPEYRTVTTLYFVEELSYQEISEIVNCPIGTVRSRLHRGRKLLQAALLELAEERGIGRGRASVDAGEAASLVA